MNKDGTLDGSRLFNNAQQFFPKVTFGAVKIFATKNNTKVLAHAGSTVVLPCTVAEESKFEMVSMFLHQKTLIHSFFQNLVVVFKAFKTYKTNNYQFFVNWLKVVFSGSTDAFVIFLKHMIQNIFLSLKF